MITTLEINRFKSIKSLTLNCRKFNLFIGEPNTGKSNILESLGFWSFLFYGDPDGGNARDFFRYETTSDLFYDGAIYEPLEVICDNFRFSLTASSGQFTGLLERANAWRIVDVQSGRRAIVEPVHVTSDSMGDYQQLRPIRVRIAPATDKIGEVKFYRFRERTSFDEQTSDFLRPPSGGNLLSVLAANRELRTAVNSPFLSRGLRLVLRPQDNKIEVVKSSWEDDIMISHPYSLASETFQRLTFYQAAILSNHDSVLVFEEPESHSFPYHTKFLAEQIALDENGNQYFIATHNPYFLLPVLEKANKDDVAVHIVYYEDYQTKTRELAPEDLAELAEIDVFTNLERYLDSR